MADIPTVRIGQYSVYYYPGNRIEIRDGQCKVVIHKPGTYREHGIKDKAVADSVIIFSSNSRVEFNLHDYIELQDIISKCIDKLNSEDGPRIVNTGMKLNLDDIIQVTDKTRPKQAVTTQFIKESQLKIGKLYEKANGKMCIYLGKGERHKSEYSREYLSETWSIYHVLEINDKSELKRIDCCLTSAQAHEFTITQYGIRLESRKTPYKFVKELGKGIPILVDYLRINSVGYVNLRFPMGKIWQDKLHIEIKR